MATITSLGAGSGLDLSGLLTNLMKVERLPLDNLQLKESSVRTRISALGTLSQKLSALQTSAKALKPEVLQSAVDKFSSHETSVGDEKAATASASAGAKAGSYSLGISQLAQGQKSRLANSDIDFNAGPLTITFDDPTRSPLTITPASGSLVSLANAINKSEAGIGATILSGDNGAQYLVLTGEEGQKNGFTLTGLGVDGKAQTAQTARDANFTLDGLPITRSSNTVTDVLEGVTLNLKGETTVGGDTTLTVKVDHGEKLKSSLEDFVNKFNDAITSLKSLGSYDAEAKTAGVLNGDRVLREAQSALSDLVFGKESDTMKLTDLGIRFKTDGKLEFDTDKLAEAVTKNPEAVANFTASVGANFSDGIDKLVGLSGTIKTRSDDLSASADRLVKQQEALETRLVKVEERYRKQFSALDTLVSQMNSSSAYLTQQLASLTQ
jgi:flagellar hook-associated protein 2